MAGIFSCHRGEVSIVERQAWPKRHQSVRQAKCLIGARDDPVRGGGVAAVAVSAN